MKKGIIFIAVCVCFSITALVSAQDIQLASDTPVYLAGDSRVHDTVLYELSLALRAVRMPMAA